MTQSKFNPPGQASLSAAITGTGEAIAVNDCRQVSWKTIYPGTPPTTGTLLIEQAPTKDYAGTWNLVDTIDCSQLSTGLSGFGTYPGQVDFFRGRFTVNADQPITLYFNGLQN